MAVNTLAIRDLLGAGFARPTNLATERPERALPTLIINEHAFDPSGILAVSFTTEAARQLRREVVQHLGDRAGDVAILMLHALGRRVIDTWAIRLGYEDRPSVLHHEEARVLLASTAGAPGWIWRPCRSASWQPPAPGAVPTRTSPLAVSQLVSGPVWRLGLAGVPS